MFRIYALFFVFFIQAMAPAHASCGLDHCPIVLPDSETEKIGLRLQIRPQYTPFKLKGFKGNYTELFLSAEYRGLKSWVFGGTLPVVLLTVEGDTRSGIGNSVVYGEWRASFDTDKSIGFGLQLELPWGSSGGVADAHWVILPYLNAHIPVWKLFFMANLGYSQAAGGIAHDHGSHDHGSSHIGEEFVFVNPHESGEFVYRLAVGVPVLQQRIQPMLMVNGQQVVVGNGEKTFVQLGARVLGRVTDTVSVYGMGELPISRAKRFTGRTSLGVMLDF